jgi:hypothetical protein
VKATTMPQSKSARKVSRPLAQRMTKVVAFLVVVLVKMLRNLTVTMVKKKTPERKTEAA